MERILNYTVPNLKKGLKTSHFLRHQGFSKQGLYLLRQNPSDILLNGKPCRMNQLLKTGDVLKVHICETQSSKNIIPVYLPLNILYEDEDILVINKAAGMPVHPSVNNHGNTLANGLAWYYANQNKAFIFRCANRLDRDTSGLILIAKHILSASILSGMTRRHEIIKEYLAIVHGHPLPVHGVIDAPLSRKTGSIIERTIDFSHGEPARTYYHVLKQKGEHSLVLLRLETGRTHQIRIHMKHLGYPLIGDYLYHPDMSHINRQALHACRLSFIHPITKEGMNFTAPLPKDMSDVISWP